MLNGQPVEAVYNRMMQTNPEFVKFVQQNQGKSPEQMACDYGIDPQLLQNIFR